MQMCPTAKCSKCSTWVSAFAMSSIPPLQTSLYLSLSGTAGMRSELAMQLQIGKRKFAFLSEILSESIRPFLRRNRARERLDDRTRPTSDRCRNAGPCGGAGAGHDRCAGRTARSEEHTSELQSLRHLVC